MQRQPGPEATKKTVSEAAELLKGVAEWTAEAAAKQKVRNANAVVGLPAVQKASLEKALAKLNDALPGLQGTEKPRAAQRIVLLLRAFLAVNDPAFANAPKLDELRAVKTKFAGGIEQEFTDLFGENIPFFADYADVLANQITVRADMADAGAASASPVASQLDAKTYFKKLKGKPGAEVAGAYHELAAAYFYHRGVASVEDLQTPLPTLLGATASITGTRPLVCTGYARLAAELLSEAGGTANQYIIGIRATPEDLRSAKHFDDAHAIVEISLGGSKFIVSNDTVKDDVDTAFATAEWANPDKPLHLTKGKTMDAAIASFIKSLDR